MKTERMDSVHWSLWEVLKFFKMEKFLKLTFYQIYKKLFPRMNNLLNIYVFCLMIFVALQSVNADEKEFPSWIAAHSYSVNTDWAIPQIAGKDFWFLIRENSTTRKKMLDISGLSDESFVMDAGVSFAHPALRTAGRMVIVREIEVLDQNGKSLTKNISVSNAGTEKLHNLEHLIDGDNNSFCYSPSARKETFEAQIILNFPNEVEIKEIKISHGYNSCKDDSVPAYCLASFNIQYFTGNTYRDISVTQKKASPSPEDIVLDQPINTSRLKFFFSAGSKEKVKDDNKMDAPFFFNGGRYTDGDFSGMRKRRTDFKRYYMLKKMYPDLCLGFLLGEWENDINWVRGEFKMSLLTGFLKQHDDLLRKYPLASLPPKTREDAAELLEAIYKKQREMLCNDVFGIGGTFCWDHYNLEWGGNLTGVEVTGCSDIPDHNLLTAFCRGAARQYHKPWMLYQAYFYIGTYPNSLAFVNNDESIYPNGLVYGEPVSLTRRGLYYAFYGGATFFDFENPDFAFLVKQTDGTYGLSAQGKTLKEMYAFARLHPDRGIPYTPIAFVLDYLHGWTGFHYGRDKVWFTIPFSDGDYMTREVMNHVWPFYDCRGFRTKIDQNKNISAGLVNTPYGDIFDALVINPPSGIINSNTLDNYKVLFLLGNIRTDAVLAERLMDYVRRGGTLIINSAQLTADYPVDFTGIKKKEIVETSEGNIQKVELFGAEKLLVDDKTSEATIVKNVYGKGFVITTLKPWLVDRERKPFKLLGKLLTKINEEALPFKIEGDIGYQINRTSDGWIVTLMNNKGIIKDPRKVEEFDLSQTSNVNVQAKFPAAQVKELLRDEIVATMGEVPLFTISVAPGDIKILKFTEFKKGDVK